jgi:putative transposase
MDMQFDATAVRRRLKFLNLIDERNRICLAIRLSILCKAKDVMAVVEELTSLYQASALIRRYNGPEFVARALRRWSKDSRTNDVKHSKTTWRVVSQTVYG